MARRRKSLFSVAAAKIPKSKYFRKKFTQLIAFELEGQRSATHICLASHEVWVPLSETRHGGKLEVKYT